MNALDKKARSTVFRNRDVLREEYSPDSLVGRDDEWDRLTDELMDAYWGDCPDDLVVYGPNGSGKTETIRKVISDFEDSTDIQGDIVASRVNCTGAKNDSDLARFVINEFRGRGEKVKRGSHDVFDKLWAELDTLGSDTDNTVLLLVLDELARTGAFNEFIYRLSRASDEYLNNVKPCLIAVSSDGSVMDQLDSDAKSSFNPTEIQFPPYDATQLQAILRDRAAEAFRGTRVVKTGNGLQLESDVLSEGLIQLTAAMATQNQAGDARKALTLLSKAGKIAYREDAAEVRREHVEGAEEQYGEEQVLRLLRNLDDHGQTIAYALVTLAADGMDSPSTNRVYKRYKRLVNHGGRDAVSKRWAQEHLNRLDKLGLTETTEQDAPGSPKTHSLSGYEIETVLEALRQQVEFYGAHESIADLETTAAGSD